MKRLLANICRREWFHKGRNCLKQVTSFVVVVSIAYFKNDEVSNLPIFFCSADTERQSKITFQYQCYRKTGQIGNQNNCFHIIGVNDSCLCYSLQCQYGCILLPFLVSLCVNLEFSGRNWPCDHTVWSTHKEMLSWFQPSYPNLNKHVDNDISYVNQNETQVTLGKFWTGPETMFEGSVTRKSADNTRNK